MANKKMNARVFRTLDRFRRTSKSWVCEGLAGSTKEAWREKALLTHMIPSPKTNNCRDISVSKFLTVKTIQKLT